MSIARSRTRLNMANQLVSVTLFRGWQLDERQKDAAEFLLFFLNKVGQVMPAWEARVGSEEGTRIVEAGSGVVHTALPEDDSDLQELIAAWSGQEHTRAMCEEYPQLPLLLGRVPYWGKSQVRIRFHQQVNMSICEKDTQLKWVYIRPNHVFFIVDLCHPLGTIVRCSDRRVLGC